MYTNVKSKATSSCFYNKAFFVSLLFVTVLVSSCFISMFSSGVSPFVSGASDRVVSNERELRTAVNNAAGSTVIALANDITLTEPLIIPVDKNITLTSASASKFFKLIGGETGRLAITPNEYNFPVSVIDVESSSVLRLDGVVVTCINDPIAWNRLVRVSVGGTLILYDGEISGNNFGDGVNNWGTFEMYGGKISNNNANAGYGGGVYNCDHGIFSMFGGEISNNIGFGVYNRRLYDLSPLFELKGGVIRNNDGGGVQNTGIFSMFGGEISNNVGGNLMQSGGGVSNSGVFSMSGGMISNNQATNGGGVYNWPDGNFSLSGNSVISNNVADVGGGIYNAGTFNRHDGIISGNTATQYSNIYPNDDDDSLMGYVVLIVPIVVIVSIVVGLFLFFKKNHKSNNR
jgi:hypothetical protein